MSHIALQSAHPQQDGILNSDLKYSHLQDLNFSDHVFNEYDLEAPKRNSLLDEKAEKYIRDSAKFEDLPGDDDDDLEDEDDDIIDLEEELEIETDEIDNDELEIVESDSDDILVDDDDADDDDDEDIL